MGQWDLNSEIRTARFLSNEYYTSIPKSRDFGLRERLALFSARTHDANFGRVEVKNIITIVSKIQETK